MVRYYRFASPKALDLALITILLFSSILVSFAGQVHAANFSITVNPTQGMWSSTVEVSISGWVDSPNFDSSWSLRIRDAGNTSEELYIPYNYGGIGLYVQTAPGTWSNNLTIPALATVGPNIIRLYRWDETLQRDVVVASTPFTVLDRPAVEAVQLRVSPSQGMSGDSVVFTLINYSHDPNGDYKINLRATQNDPSSGQPATNFAFTVGGVDTTPSPKWIQAAADAWTITYTLNFGKDYAGNGWIYASGDSTKVLAYTPFNFLATQYALTLVHHGAFDQDVLANQAPAGEITATLKQANGNTVSQANLYFFVEKGDPNFYSANSQMPIRMPNPLPESAYLEQTMPQLNLEWTQCFGGTYNTGVISMNYIQQDLISYSLLLEYIKFQHPLGVGNSMRIYSIAFDLPLSSVESGAKPKPVATASVDIVYNSIAVVGKITNQVSITSTISGYQQTLPFTDKNTPCQISPDDVITMPRGSKLTIVWLSGTRMSMEPKASYDECSFSIGMKDLGWMRSIRNLAAKTVTVVEYVHTVHGGYELYLAWAGEGAIAAKAALLMIVLLPVGIAADWLLEPNVESDYSNEAIVMGVHSTILVDQDLNSTSIYTLEGQATLYKNDSTDVAVTTGNSINITQTGVYGPVKPFTTSGLSSDQQALMEFAQVQATTQPTSSPSAMSQNNFPVTSPSESSQTGFQLIAAVTSVLPYLLVGVGAIVVVVVALAVFMRRNKQHTSPPSIPPPPPPPTAPLNVKPS
jgi:hypothetical protein